ncbi:hypothetical protein JOM56_000060 [Amanita muscaria]
MSELLQQTLDFPIKSSTPHGAARRLTSSFAVPLSQLFFLSIRCYQLRGTSQMPISNNNPNIARVQADKAFFVAIGAPVWFAPAVAIASLRAIKVCFQATKDHMERDFGAVKSQGSYNATGAGSEYEIVPFRNGQDCMTSPETILDHSDIQLDT